LQTQYKASLALYCVFKQKYQNVRDFLAAKNTVCARPGHGPGNPFEG